MAFDFKKEFKEFYLPPSKPVIVTLPVLNYIAISGKGDPNEEGGEYKEALEQLYGIAYTLKMSYKSDYKIEGFFEYVVPPLEGLWWPEGGTMNYGNKGNLCFISMIRLPDFVMEKDVEWAIGKATRKKKKRLLKSDVFPLR
ncbi:GyrI-like domain-containing protein [Porphyromonas sp.]|uniref:GyrI-like domain-containing protein n=1 Tax=Porphyromonas sp. TaxID=1924944 RepID=UPI0026DB3F10|nr:GyrI-like domain-containing protein [Porphyromonas sp.]MDO4771265.1 GyrI-like domain-containing protein [Porphyromonas sp.]